MHKFTNKSTGPRGIHDTKGGLVMIDPGKSADVEVNDRELADAEAGDWFDVEAGEAPAVAATADRFDAMTDPELREFIEAKTDKAPHPMTGREKLLAKAREAADGEA